MRSGAFLDPLRALSFSRPSEFVGTPKKRCCFFSGGWGGAGGGVRREQQNQRGMAPPISFARWFFYDLVAPVFICSSSILPSPSSLLALLWGASCSGQLEDCFDVPSGVLQCMNNASTPCANLPLELCSPRRVFYFPLPKHKYARYVVVAVVLAVVVGINRSVTVQQNKLLPYYRISCDSAYSVYVSPRS